LKEQICIDCGKVFNKSKMAHNLVRCPECNAKYKEKQYEKYKEKEKLKRKADGAAPRGVKDLYTCKKVKTCQYRGKMAGIDTCDYMLVTGHRRPCDIQGCTEYKRGKSLSIGKKANAYDVL